MGSGFNDFTAGDVLTAAQVDGLLMRQTIMVFASTSARDTALSGNLEEGMHTYQTDTNTVTWYDGSAWRTLVGPPTSFTPSWTNVTLGSGSSETWYYRYSGRRLHIYGSTTLGTGGALTGDATMTVPNSETIGSGLCIAIAHYTDATSTNVYGHVRAVGGETVLRPQTLSNAAIAATNPFTWTVSDIIRFDITIPVA